MYCIRDAEGCRAARQEGKRKPQNIHGGMEVGADLTKEDA